MRNTRRFRKRFNATKWRFIGFFFANVDFDTAENESGVYVRNSNVFWIFSAMHPEVKAILLIFYDKKDLPRLNETILLIAKKRSQLKKVTARPAAAS